MDRVDPVPQKSKSNLSPEEQNALAQLLQNDEIIIKPADKGGCLVIMNKEFYRDKLVMNDHLNTDTCTI